MSYCSRNWNFVVFRCVLFNWFRSYLDDSKQRVHPKLLPSSKLSNWHNVEHGVLKGSILRPLLFSLFGNDFPMLINEISDIIMFADDANKLITVNFQDELLQRFNVALNHMSEWFQANRLNVNPTKNKYLKLTSAEVPSALHLKYTDYLLLEMDTIKFLGLKLDNQIAWKNHIQLLIRKLSSACLLMKQLYYIINTDSLKLFYFADSIVKWHNILV